MSKYNSEDQDQLCKESDHELNIEERIVRECKHLLKDMYCTSELNILERIHVLGEIVRILTTINVV